MVVLCDRKKPLLESFYTDLLHLISSYSKQFSQVWNWSEKNKKNEKHTECRGRVAEGGP